MPQTRLEELLPFNLLTFDIGPIPDFHILSSPAIVQYRVSS